MTERASARTIEILGAAVVDIPTFYDEVNRAFMANEDWSLGQSLDALNDMLYGGYGAIDGNASTTLIWQDIALSRVALGVQATLAFLREKLSDRRKFDGAAISSQIAALEQGQGRTFFDIVMDIIADHPNITLVGR